MTRRGIFSTFVGFIAGLFGTARAQGGQSPWIKLTPGPTKEVRTYIIHSSDVCAGEYPNMKCWTKTVKTSNPEVIKFLDLFLLKVYPNKMPRFVWKKSVRIEYAPGQYVADKQCP